MEPSARADLAEGAAATSLSERWAAFTQAESIGAFAQSWLALVSEQVGRTRRAMVLLRGADGSFAPVAFWPAADTDMTDLAEPARRCLAARAAQAEALVPPAGAPAGPPGLVLAYPVDLRGELRGAVVMDVAGRPEAQVQQAFRALTWGMGWLDAMLRGEEVAQLAHTATRSREVIDLMLRVAEARALDEAAHLAVDGLAERLRLGRASLGLIADGAARPGADGHDGREGRDGRVRLQAMSATAWFDGRSALARRLENAMEEAWDQRGSIAVPALPGRPVVVDLAHQAVAGGGTQAVAVASAIVLARSQALGVLTIERPADQPFDDGELQALEAWAQALGPVLALHREGERWLAGRARRQWLAVREALTDPRRPSWRIGAGLALLALVALVFVDGQWRISAPASIEGATQRAVVAPFEGFVRTAPVKAGQRVKAGEVLATLDDRDLLLERARYASERDRHERRYRDALSRHERAEARMAAAEMAEAQAQLALVEERLARTRLVAPYDGLVVSGDLTQQLGSPVEKGKTLFEVAPLDAFRVVLKVDESDMRGVAVGQRGQLVLAGLTSDKLGFAVRGISVAAPAEGRNAFEVEAQLDAAPPGLRPGMEGVGKIEAGERRLLWIWTHRFTDWLRLKLWQWWP
ncbi:HlyD family efflux transporter periplasmic adaptor subunit [Ideonella sp. DXS22W]|uniref:HlyD family efflux transporter periplasmic adaptor subunit n=1 Tax=Pseudaquabacterium inlustre TaxID=2984192 RepID=A0ABU9CCX9_9BURK